MFRGIFLVPMIIVQASSGRTTATTGHGFYVGKGILERLESGLLDNMSVFSKRPSISITECVTNCMTRDECSYIYYIRRSTMCYFLKEVELNTEGDGLVNNVLALGVGVVFGVKAEWQEDSGITSLNTSNAVSTACGAKPYVPNTIRKGNMDNVGAKGLYQCDAAFYPTGLTTVITTCRSDGKWDTVSLQCPGREIIDRCNTTGSVWLRNESCYSIPRKLFSSYWEAKNRCEDTGGHLVFIADQEEQEFIEDMLRVELEKMVYDKPLYIGVDPNRWDGFRWTNGSNVVYDNWAQGEPRQTYRCVVIDPSNNFKWVIERCLKSLYDLCEFDLP